MHMSDNAISVAVVDLPLIYYCDSFAAAPIVYAARVFCGRSLYFVYVCVRVCGCVGGVSAWASMCARESVHGCGITIISLCCICPFCLLVAGYYLCYPFKRC
jgi:hypothetical protein